MTKSNFTLFLLYSYGCILLLEWVRPIDHLTTTDHMKLFMFYMVIVFTVSFFKVKKILQWLINIILVLFFVNRFHYDIGFFQFKWIIIFISHLFENMVWLITGQLNELTYEFKTFLFILFLSINVYFINFFLNRNWIFYLLLLTVLYISILDSFTDYEAKFAIIRTVLLGFTTMSLLIFDNLLDKGRVHYYSEYIKKWMIPLVSMIILFVLIGSLAPKPSPIWTFPNWSFKVSNQDGNGSGGGTKTVGYDSDDAFLGGSIKSNDSPVFQYESNQRTYWKMETKDTYTGRGWVDSESTQRPLKKEDFVMLNTYPDTIETKIETAKVKIDDNYQYHYIMYPEGITKVVNILPFESGINVFKLDTAIERISYFKNSIPEIPASFEVEYEIPRYKAKDLIKTVKLDSNLINATFYQNYTQLPANLPKRIGELAQQITTGKTNWYDKAKAIENYFDQAEFKYTQKNVAFPSPNEDYVDQFLFDTKTGYCNNFSSSMAVMLRTLGVPTRWVKGFTGGNFVNNSKKDTSKQIYEVTADNAHSWVEVFLPNQGWVSFEPTKGFSNELNISTSNENSSTSEEQELPTNVIKKNKPNPALEVDGEVSKKTEKTNVFSSLWYEIKQSKISDWKEIILTLGLILVVTGILYLNRRKWLPYFFMLIYRFSKKEDRLESAYLTLLRQLARYGLKRNENETLRSYAKYIDSLFTTNDMTELTMYYEQYLYQQVSQEENWEKCLDLWKNLMKRTI